MDGNVAHVNNLADKVSSDGNKLKITGLKYSLPHQGRCIVMVHHSEDAVWGETVPKMPESYYSESFFVSVSPMDSPEKKRTMSHQPIDGESDHL